MNTSPSPIDFTPTEIAQYISETAGIKISNRQVNQVLCELGLQKQIRTPNKRFHWMLTDKGKKYGHIYRVTSLHSQWSGTQIKWSEDVIKIIQQTLVTIGK